MGAFRRFVEVQDWSDDKVLGIVQNSPQMRANVPSDYDWGHYRDRWGIQGGFVQGRMSVADLIDLIRNNYCRLSRTGDDAIADKMQRRDYNAVVITRPPSEPLPLAVLDGSHSLVAAWKNKEEAIDVIASSDAVRWLGAKFNSS